MYNIAMKVETAGEVSTVYRIAEQLCRDTQASVSIVKDKEFRILEGKNMHR